MEWDIRFWQMENFAPSVLSRVLSGQERAASIQWVASAVTQATADNLGYFHKFRLISDSNLVSFAQ